ncbi:MAG: LOG family protein [Candidatus Aenigmarchaeota archaeon]|nr:LOG family protein [Candidatus Aenigmarchaeota archaeon]
MKETIDSILQADRRIFRVAIFGSARIKKNDANYRMIYRLAKMIGKEHVDIVTGGGPGIMEAANKGHKAGSNGNGAHSMGLLIKLPNEQKSNKHIDIKKEYRHFSERLDNFMMLSSAVVVAPGGLGTLLELVYAWQLMQVRHTCEIPLIVIGDMWKEFVAWSKKWQLRSAYMKPEDFDSIYTVATADDAMEILKQAHEQYLKAGKNACFNTVRYGKKLHVNGKKAVLRRLS